MTWDVTQFTAKDDYKRPIERYVLTFNGVPHWVSDNYGKSILVNTDRLPSNWTPLDLKPGSKLTNSKVSFYLPMFVSGWTSYVNNSFQLNLGGEKDWIALAEIYKSFTPIEDKVPVQIAPDVYSFRRKTTYGTVGFLPNGGVGAVYCNTNGKGIVKTDYYSTRETGPKRHFADQNVRSVLTELGAKGLVL